MTPSMSSLVSLVTNRTVKTLAAQSAVLVFVSLLAIAIPVFAADSGYHVIKSIPIPGLGAWDYIGIDVENRHVLVSHGYQLDILNADTYQLDGKILAPGVDPAKPETMTNQGIRGGAAAPDIGRGFVPNSRDGSVTVFDLKTLQPLGVVHVGASPDGYVYDPATGRGFTFSNGTKGAAAIDLRNLVLAGTVPLGSKPEAAAADGQGLVFVNMQEKDMVTRIDSRALVAQGSWPTGPCHQPSSMAMDTKSNRLFIGCRGTSPVLEVMDASNGNIVTTIPIGAGTDAAAFDPGTHLVFTSNGEGTISVIHEDSPDKYTFIENAKTESGARTMALDTKTHRMFLITADRATAPASGSGRASGPPPIVPGTFRVLVVGRE